MRSRGLAGSKLSLIAASIAALAALTGCSKDDGKNADMVAGKKLFVQKCGSCHVLGRAGSKGTTGPNLDEAFQQAAKDGFGESAFRGVIRDQIDVPARGGVMPADLVKGKDADNVAAYVASVVAKGGKDEGLLATAVTPAGSNKPAVAKDGKLDIPADPGGQLLFVNKTAEAPAGQLTIEMPNQSGTLHDISIPGKGTSRQITKGTTSFSATFAPGKYQYLCTVPGHAEAGMKGTLTVK
jgi:mono/diheme cytochrome c family protein